MASVKQHLQKLHEDSVAHHEAAAKSHRVLAKLFKAEGGLESAADISDAHQALAKCHDQAATTHSEMLKSVGVDDLDKGALNRIVPDGISAIPRTFGSITAIPRAGAPSRPVNGGEQPNVPIEFAHLVKVEHVE